MGERVQVVTVFVTHKGKIFLIKRSDQVGTYRGYWAAISGYMENLPLLQARQELLEETGLGPEDVRLKGIGAPVPVDDDAHNFHWLVFPFLFETDRPEKVRTDWEASDSRWAEPSELASLRTVPGLDAALKAVWPPFGPQEFWDALERVATDTLRGSNSLVLDGLATLADLGAEHDAQRAITAFSACRPSMGAFPNLAERLRHASDLRNACRELESEIARAVDESAKRAAEWLRGAKRVFTHSRSSSVAAAILAWAKETDRAEVIVTESRPKLEGVGLAEHLAKEGIRVTLITDAQMSHFIPICDAVIVGCDAITPSGEVVNKVGTRLAILAARASGIRTCAVAQTYKIMPKNWPDVVEEQAPSDVGSIGLYRIRNVIFDRTPVGEFDVVIGL